jgi:hypothetical protein
MEERAKWMPGSYNDLTDKPPLGGFIGQTGPQGPPGDDGEDGAQGPKSDPGSSEWADISNKTAWVADTQSSVKLSGFNNDLSLACGDVELADVLNKPTFFSGSYNDLTDRPSIEDLTGPQGPQGEPGLNGASEWLEISNKPAWVADTQVSVNMSGFNNDLSLAGGDVEWADVLNKPTFFSGSYNDLTGKPTWVAISQASVSLSGFNNDLTATSVEWADLLNKPKLFSGVEEMRRKPSSIWSWMSHSVRCSGAHSTMYCVWLYSVSLCLEMMRVTSQGG